MKLNTEPGYLVAESLLTRLKPKHNYSKQSSPSVKINLSNCTGVEPVIGTIANLNQVCPSRKEAKSANLPKTAN